MKPAGVLAVVAGLGCHFALGACSLLFEESAGATDADADVRVLDGDVVRLDGTTQFDAQTEDCAGIIAVFDDVPATNPQLALYAGLEFGTGNEGWRVYRAGEFGLSSAAMTFDSQRALGLFGFSDGERVLRGLRFYWANTPITLVISDGVNPEITVALNTQIPSIYIETNWTMPSANLTVSSDAGFRFFVDDVCHAAPQS